MPDAALLISTAPPTTAQRRAAWAVGAALLLLFIAALPLASVPFLRVPATVPVVSTIMALGDCASAVLLLGQFAVLRLRALLVLAGGYLCTGLLVIAYALTFPGAFPDGSIPPAGLQTAAWIFVFWHLGLPVTVIAYTLLRDARPALQHVATAPATAIGQALAIATVLALAFAGLAIVLHDRLPVVVVDVLRLSQHAGVSATLVSISLAAVVALGARRRSVLDYWLLVACFAWLLDSILTSLTVNRYSGAWYANRAIRIIAANVVLFVLLAESTRLYARLASSVLAQRRERAARALGMEAMSAAIEHEVRQPLAAIVANAGAVEAWLARSPASVGESREAMGAIVADAQRATEILRSVRQAFASRDTGSEPLDTNALVEETVDLARVDLESLAIGVQLQLGASVPRVAANRQQLQEVILNLVNNAAEAMREVTGHAAVLRIATAAIEDGRVQISVADTGPGIDARDIEHIFEPFFTTKPGGMGMGLAICKTIVERHQGVLSVARGEPYGSVFNVVLPCGQEKS